MLVFLSLLAGPVGASTTYYVATNGNDGAAGTDWSTALLTITNAVVRSSGGDTVLVSNGTYNATGLGTVDSGTNFIYLNKAITLKSFSGNPEDTILHGNGMTNRLVYIPGAGSGCVLDGFTLTNGYSWSWVGGGLVITTNALITNCIITGCRSDAAAPGGGGVYCTGPATMAWCRVVGNVAMYTRNVQSGGGGIYCASNASYTFIITNCDIGYNSIGAGEGGGICASRNVRIYNSHIFGNTIVSNAGLIYGGGGVAWYYGGPYLKDCVISNNIQTNYTGYGSWGGGAKNCILDHCWVLSNTGVSGGGVYGGIISNGTVIAGNYASSGGGGYNVDMVYDSLISNNIAATSSYGGGGLNSSAINTVISNCLILNNLAINGVGGGVSWYYLNYNNDQRIVNCRIIGNLASNSYGGGMFVALNYPGGTGLVQNCLFANNVATNGGGFYGGGAIECRVLSSTIVSNRAISYGGGVNSDSTFTNCIIASNTAGANPDVTTSYTNNFWYCCVPSRLLQPGQGNITNDPAFSNFAAGNFRLTTASPCKNTGFNQNWMYPAQDLDNTNSRILYGTVDIGCYEYGDPSVLSCMFAADPFSALAPSTNVFTASVYGGDLTGLGYLWDFTNTGAEIAGGAVMTNVYASPGHYSPRLKITNAAGAAAVFTNLYYIKAGPLTYYLATNAAGVRPFTNGYSQGASNIADVMPLATLPGDQVLVSTGLYRLASAIALQTGVVFRSINTNPAEATLHGNGVTRCVNLATNALIEGITLTNNPNVKLSGIYQNAGVFQNSGGTIRNCIISGGNVKNYGAGFMQGGMVTNCLIAGNRAGELPTYTNYCGGIYIYSNGVIANCIFRDNQLTNNGPGQNLGGAIYMYRGGLVQNCVFTNNYAPYGGALALQGAGTVQNCLFISNQAVLNGGAIYATNDASLPALSNVIVGCTIAGNTSLTNGGGVFVCQNTYVLNSIVVSNVAGVSGSNYYNFGSGMEYQYCDTRPIADLPGTGNIDGEPGFINPAGQNYRLAGGSPCIDAGYNFYWATNGTSDLDGHPRVLNGLVDIGAYENPLPALMAAPAVQTSSVMQGLIGTSAFRVWNTNAITNDMLMSLATNADWMSLGVGTQAVIWPATNTVTLTNRTAELGGGTYTGTVTALASNVLCNQYPPVTQTVSVVLNVMAPMLDATGLTNYVMLGATPTNRTFRLNNAGAGAFNYTATTANAPWLAVSPGTGTVTTATNTLTLAYASTLGWTPGASNGVIQIASSDGGGATQTVSVTVEALVPPVLSASPAALAQVISQGSYASNQIFTVCNHSLTPRLGMGYTVAAASYTKAGQPTNWLWLGSVGGTTVDGTNAMMALYRDFSGFAVGTYTGLITLTATNVWESDELPLGSVTQTATIAVSVLVTSPSPPAAVSATKGGTNTQAVVVSWTASLGAATYQVWRSPTFDVNAAYYLAQGMSTTVYADTSATPGVPYYYWVRAVSAYQVVGELSATNDWGYRALSPPGGVFASDGVYTDRIAVTWSAADGAESYLLYRGIEGGVMSLLYHAAQTELAYTDRDAAEHTRYVYQLQSKNSRYESALGGTDTGYILSRPTGLTADQAKALGSVHLSWNPVYGAVSYEIFRGVMTLNHLAVSQGQTLTTSWDDTAVSAGTTYYYWVKARNAAAVSAFSEMATGYRASDGVDLSAAEVVVLPGRRRPGSHPAVASFRLGNAGQAALAPPNTAVGIAFYAATNAVYANAVGIGGVTQAVTLAAGTNTTVIVNPAAITLPGSTGTLYVFVTVLPAPPSTLVETNPPNNTALRVLPIQVQTNAPAAYLGLNDYDGDGISDLGVYRDGLWYVRAVDGRVLAWGFPCPEEEESEVRSQELEFSITAHWSPARRSCASSAAGGLLTANSFLPTFGDYDGDGKADPAAYDTQSGAWVARLSGGGYASVSALLGGAGAAAVPADVDGDGRMDPLVYQQTGTDLTPVGTWQGLLSASGYMYGALLFGDPDCTAVPGDYDGDGRWDLALYHAGTGRWYIQTSGGTPILWGEFWGSPGYQPACGDYDGDGIWDLAVYQETTGYWYVRTVAGTLLAWGYPWGAPGCQPVYGDYDGDGRTDLAIYHEATGAWFVLSPAGTILLWNSSWGAPGYKPVSW